MSYDLIKRVDEIEKDLRRDRGKVYGDPLENHKGIASIWTPLLQPHVAKIKAGEPLPPWTVALMMAALKIDRMRVRYCADNFHDCLIYLAFADEWQRAEAETEFDSSYDARGGKGWICTRSGKHFDIIKPSASQIDIEDIAASLSRLCRFTGHCKRFYSVAEHSLHVVSILPPELQLWGLLHDASEAYMGDCSRPLKARLREFRVLEHELEVQIAKAFSLPWPCPKAIKEADAIMLSVEARDLLGQDIEAHPDVWEGLPMPPDDLCVPEEEPTCRTVEQQFLEKFYELYES